MRRFVFAIAVAACCYSAAVAIERPQYQFAYVPLNVGDRAVESLHFQLDMKTVLAQEGQVVGTVDQTVDRQEHSTVLRLQAAAGEAARAQITYDASHQRVSIGHGEAVKENDLPVAGRSYVVARVGEELRIAAADGREISEDERKIVARSLDALARPNPLGVFLNGRTVREGELIRLPAEFSDRLLSQFDESLDGFPLDVMLMGIERVDGKLCAVFHTPPAAALPPGADRSPIDGKFVIEIDSCRLAGLEIRGPVNAVEHRGAPGQEFDRRRKGKVQVSLHIEHHRAVR